MDAQIVLPRIAGSTTLTDCRENLAKIHQHADRFWDDYIANFDQLFLSTDAELVHHYSPPLDFLESDTAYLFEAELPGLRQQDVSIEIVANALIIQGEKRRRNTECGARAIRSERKYGVFRLTAPLPNNGDVESIHANLDDGILTVLVEKLPACPALSQQIKIQAAA